MHVLLTVLLGTMHVLLTVLLGTMLVLLISLLETMYVLLTLFIGTMRVLMLAIVRRRVCRPIHNGGEYRVVRFMYATTVRNRTQRRCVPDREVHVHNDDA